MIMVSTQKDLLTGKQMVISWCYVTKEYTISNPAIPGTRIYFNNDEVPLTLFKSGISHYLDSGKICPLYPNTVTRFARNLD